MRISPFLLLLLPLVLVLLVRPAFIDRPSSSPLRPLSVVAEIDFPNIPPAGFEVVDTVPVQVSFGNSEHLGGQSRRYWLLAEDTILTLPLFRNNEGEEWLAGILGVECPDAEPAIRMWDYNFKIHAWPNGYATTEKRKLHAAYVCAHDGSRVLFGSEIEDCQTYTTMAYSGLFSTVFYAIRDQYDAGDYEALKKVVQDFDQWHRVVGDGEGPSVDRHGIDALLGAILAGDELGKEVVLHDRTPARHLYGGKLIVTNGRIYRTRIAPGFFWVKGAQLAYKSGGEVKYIDPVGG